MFYRTSTLNDIIYFILFDNNGKRDSFKVLRDKFGKWMIQSTVPQIIEKEAEFIDFINRNEGRLDGL